MVLHVFHTCTSLSQLLEHEDLTEYELINFLLNHILLYIDIFKLKCHLGTGSGKNDAMPAVS